MNRHHRPQHFFDQKNQNFVHYHQTPAKLKQCDLLMNIEYRHEPILVSDLKDDFETLKQYLNQFCSRNITSEMEH